MIVPMIVGLIFAVLLLLVLLALVWAISTDERNAKAVALLQRLRNGARG
jgi:hypothetical protein